jgi:hypothetical protein
VTLSIGVAFVGTGGQKMVRALRSFRCSEPDMPVHLVFDASTNSWWQNLKRGYSVEWFESQPNVHVKVIDNTGYVNGAFNAGIRWLDSLGFQNACMFHDDLVFSPLAENRHHLTDLFARMETDPELYNSSGLTLPSMEALVPSPIPGHWQRSPDEWAAVDLESDSLWRTMCPGGVSAMYFGSPGSDDGVSLGDWFVKYFVTERPCPISRLGPTGFIIPISHWREFAQFDERDGIYYDMEYPVLCAMRKLAPVIAVPGVPHLHLHNQSTAYGDPAVGTWGHDLPSFIAKYGKEPGDILAEHGYYGYQSMPVGVTCPEPNLRIWKYGGQFAKAGV